MYVLRREGKALPMLLSRRQFAGLLALASGFLGFGRDGGGVALAKQPKTSPLGVSGNRQPTTAQQGKEMKIQDVFVLICTDKIYECRDFYIKTFGFEVTFQSSIYIQLSVKSENGGGFSLAFMPTNNPFGEPFKAPYQGQGVYVTLQVADAAAVLEHAKEQGAPVVLPLKDEDWGQRHFVTRDPHGTIVDVVQSIEAKPNYYDRYQPAR